MSAHSHIKYYLTGILTAAALAPAVGLAKDIISRRQNRWNLLRSDVEDEDIFRRNDTKYTEAKGYVDEIGLPTFDLNIHICKEITMAGKVYQHVLRFCDSDAPWVGGAAIYRFRDREDYKMFSCVMGCIDPSRTTENCRLSAFLDGICALRVEMGPSDPPQRYMVPLKNARSIQLAMNNGDYCLAEAQFR